MKRLLNRQKMILDFIKSCNEALAEEPGNTQIIRLRGLMFNIAGDYDNAIRDFEQLIQARAKEPEVYYLKSDCHYSKGEFDQAKRDYMRGLKLQHGAEFTEQDIDRAVVSDDQDLQDIKTVISHEKEQAILQFFRALNADQEI